MSGSFNMLSHSEMIKFWQDIENKIKQALRQCENQLPAGIIEEITDYLEHNELGLAWETLGGELVMLEIVPPEPARRLIFEAGIRMGFDQPEAQNHALWKSIETLFNAGN